MLVVPFTMRNDSNKHFAKANRPPACCLQNCLGGPFFLGLAPARNSPTRIGSGWSTNCGSTSATASRQQPANAFLTSVLPRNARRPPTRRLLEPLNSFLMNELPSKARRLCVANASSTRRPLVANVLPTHDRCRQPESSSCGFAVDASTPGLLARLCSNSNMKPLSPACDTSRNATCTRQWRTNGNDRQQAAAPQEKALANEADERCCKEEAARTAASAEMALAKERCHHKEAEHATLSAASSLAVEQRCHEVATRTAASADMALAKEQRCHETAKIAAMLA